LTVGSKGYYSIPAKRVGIFLSETPTEWIILIQRAF